MDVFLVFVWLGVFAALLNFSWSFGQDSNSDRFRVSFYHGRGKIPVSKEGRSARPPPRAALRHRDEMKYVLHGGDIISQNTVLQRLDHFDGMNTRRWRQRYWINDQFYRKNGPVFLYIASGAIGDDLYWIGDGDKLPDWLKKAEKFGAICFFLEHRYYGESKPTASLSVRNMKYLNTYQALADIAHFIKNATIQHHVQGAPWVLFGCSYAGALAAWSRLKYPHLVSIAVSSSAPLQAKLDFSEYAEVVTKVLKAENEECIVGIRNATNTIEQWLHDSKKLSQLKKLFNLCEDLNPSDQKNVSFMLAQLAENIFTVVQDSKINYGLTKTNYTTATICSTMINRNLGDYIKRYAAIQRLIMAYKGFKCLSINYKSLIEFLRNDIYRPNEDWRQWSYQVCNEFGFYYTTSSPNQPFGNRSNLDFEFVPISYYMDQCIDIFGSALQKSVAQSNVEETLRQYGGNHPEMSKVIFTFGTHDPWYPLGVSESNNLIGVIPIEGASHCADFYAPDAITDSKSLKSSRRLVDRLLEKWIENRDSDGAEINFACGSFSFLPLIVPFIVKITL